MEARGPVRVRRARVRERLQRRELPLEIFNAVWARGAAETPAQRGVHERCEVAGVGADILERLGFVKDHPAPLEPERRAPPAAEALGPRARAGNGLANVQKAVRGNDDVVGCELGLAVRALGRAVQDQPPDPLRKQLLTLGLPVG